MPHKELRPEDITAVIDTREQKPWQLTPLKTVKKKLHTGDYSILGLEASICLERKSLGDYLGSLGGSRTRFTEVIQRMSAYPVRAIIVEANFQDVVMGRRKNHGEMTFMSKPVRSNVTPEAAIGSTLGWMASNIPILFCADADQASLMAARFLFIAARRRFRELAGFYDSLRVE